MEQDLPSEAAPQSYKEPTLGSPALDTALNREMDTREGENEGTFHPSDETGPKRTRQEYLY